MLYHQHFLTLRTLSYRFKKLRAKFSQSTPELQTVAVDGRLITNTV